MFTVYLITNLITNKKYVGITSQGIKKRWREHNYDSSCCRYLKHSLQKYGKNNFTIEEIFCAFTKQDLKIMEDYFIQQYNSIVPNGYNLREGGRFGLFSEESKKQCSKAQLEVWKNEERKKKYSINMKEQWKQPELREKRYNPIKDYINKKKRPVIGVHIDNNNIIEYSSLNDAVKDGYYDKQVKESIKNNKPYKNYLWKFKY